jgi:hypothetical protein
MTDQVEQSDVAYEESDVSVRGIVKFGLALSVAIGMVCLLVWGLFELFYARAAKIESAPPPLYRGDRLPPEPRLQGMPGNQDLPSEEIREFRKREEIELNSYGWIIPPSGDQAGVVHIPIERAKELIVERGLSAPTAGAMQNAPPEKRQ